MSEVPEGNDLKEDTRSLRLMAFVPESVDGPFLLSIAGRTGKNAGFLLDNPCG